MCINCITIKQYKLVQMHLNCSITFFYSNLHQNWSLNITKHFKYTTEQNKKTAIINSILSVGTSKRALKLILVVMAKTIIGTSKSASEHILGMKANDVQQPLGLPQNCRWTSC